MGLLGHHHKRKRGLSSVHYEDVLERGLDQLEELEIREVEETADLEMYVALPLHSRAYVDRDSLGGSTTKTRWLLVNGPSLKRLTKS